MRCHLLYILCGLSVYYSILYVNTYCNDRGLCPGWLVDRIAWNVRRVICTSLLGWFLVVLSWTSGRDGQKQDQQIRYSEGRLLIMISRCMLLFYRVI